MATTLNLIPAKADFPKMYVPVVFYEKYISNKLEFTDAKEENFNIQKRFNEINPIMIKNKNVFIGPANCYSYDMKYNKIVGLDNIDIYLETDNGETNFVHGISENHFYKTGAHVGVMEPEEFDVNEIVPGMRIYDGNKIFEAGNYLIKKYPIRSGSTVNFHCFDTYTNKAACIFYIPKKRDQTSVLIDFVQANDEENLDSEIITSIFNNDPKKDKYPKIIVSKFEDISRICIGFFEVSTHINIFEFDGVTRLQGVSFND